MRGHEYAELRALSAVATHGSYTRAASDLRISPSALSQIIRRLEARVGTKLLNRTTRSVRVTDAGAQLLARVDAAFAELDGAVEEVGRANDRARGVVRLNAPRIAIPAFVSPILGAFVARYPDVSVEVVVDDALTDIVASGCDLGIRLGERLALDAVATPLGGRLEMMAVASAAYLEEHGIPLQPADLRRHRCVNYRLLQDGGLYAWEFERDGHAFAMAVDGPVVTSDHQMMLDAALQGVGIAYLLDFQVRSLVESGRLLRVLADWSPRFPGFFLYRPMRRHTSLAVERFAEALSRSARP